MLTRLWQTVQGLRELNRTAPVTLARRAAEHAEQVKQLQQATANREAVWSKMAETVDKTTEAMTSEQQAAIARRLQDLEARLSAVQLDPARIQKKAMANMVDNFEEVLLKSGVGGAGKAGGGSASGPGATGGTRRGDKDGGSS